MDGDRLFMHPGEGGDPSALREAGRGDVELDQVEDALLQIGPEGVGGWNALRAGDVDGRCLLNGQVPLHVFHARGLLEPQRFVRLEGPGDLLRYRH